MPTVLVVEDDEEVRRLLQQILEIAEYQVIAVDGPESAREAIQMRPAVVLMDVMLHGDMSGIELALELKRDYPDSAFIAMSASDLMLQLAQQTDGDTFSGYLGKPYRDIGELFAALERAIKPETGA